MTFLFHSVSSQLLWWAPLLCVCLPGSLSGPFFSFSAHLLASSQTFLCLCYCLWLWSILLSWFPGQPFPTACFSGPQIAKIEFDIFPTPILSTCTFAFLFVRVKYMENITRESFLNEFKKHWRERIHLYFLRSSVTYSIHASLVAQKVKNLPATRETWVWSLGWEDPLEEDMATHSSILAWRIPMEEEPGGLQSMGSQRVRHDWVTKPSTQHNVYIRRIEEMVCKITYNNSFYSLCGGPLGKPLDKSPHLELDS